ncbi:MAG: glycosyltransferase family 2 protein [Balneolaceae bacterium]
MKGFSIIIVTWNGVEHLKTFLPSVVETNYDDFEIILADNASTDDSVEWVTSNFPTVKIASFDDNYGYTGGNNRAVPFAEKEILIFLNNDVKVDPEWLHGISSAFESDSAIAAVQPKILSFEEPEYFEYAGAAGGYLDRFGYPFCRGRLFDSFEKDEGQYDTIKEIAWASGAALAIKKDVFESLNGFDEDFQFHMEEIDLCWRTCNSGYKISYTPNSTVYHLGGGSLPMGSSRKVYYNFRNNLFMLIKNLPANELWYKLPFRYKLDIIAAWRSLLTGKSNEFTAIARAHKDFIFGFRTMYRKRKLTPNKSGSTILSPVFLIWQYFVKGKRRFSDLF